ncbi:N-(5'-phosphoribosyl)anthranilate isomerase [Rhodovulum sp. 12E13]|uniref:N-(5'-phosphoribosyl)anthranilate isomerase n=1 Tax=Rhodovulum sp. 12E13 TaxID=2203891 RepID=UPI000E160A80|nr:N-(5'-phosphoribosyl)anthranilate isomerase [Rhodovulum sp. 12E13]RDC73415.1 N-(5'-phosphoribosyl)anthranilate isomerase [Rhodovulum sp. 12E13]
MPARSLLRLPGPDAARWRKQIFACRAAAQGGFVRRKAADVDRIVGRAAFVAEMRRRGFPVDENAGQYAIFCNSAPIRRLC